MSKYQCNIIGMLYRDDCEIVWLLIFYAFQTMVTISYIQQNPTEMHWYVHTCCNNDVPPLNAAKRSHII